MPSNPHGRAGGLFFVQKAEEWRILSPGVLSPCRRPTPQHSESADDSEAPSYSTLFLAGVGQCNVRCGSPAVMCPVGALGSQTRWC